MKLCRINSNTALSVVMIVCATALSGCEILSICTFPSDKLAASSALPTGKFVTVFDNELNDDSLLEVVEDGVGYRMLSENSAEYLELFELDGYLGFNLRKAMPKSNEMKQVPEMQREMINGVHRNGIYPWHFGAIEMYGDAFMMLVPMADDTVEAYLKQHDILIISGGISQSASRKNEHSHGRTDKNENAGEVDKLFAQADLSSYENPVLVINPDQLEHLTGELLRSDSLIPLVYLPKSVSDDFHGLEDDELIQAMREYNRSLADRYEHIMSAFEAREDAED